MENRIMYRLLIQNKSYTTGSMDKITAEALKWSKVFTHIRIEPAA